LAQTRFSRPVFGPIDARSSRSQLALIFAANEIGGKFKWISPAI
jgi:hypothetical protein